MHSRWRGYCRSAWYRAESSLSTTNEADALSSAPFWIVSELLYPKNATGGVRTILAEALGAHTGTRLCWQPRTTRGCRRTLTDDMVSPSGGVLGTRLTRRLVFRYQPADICRSLAAVWLFVRSAGTKRDRVTNPPLLPFLITRVPLPQGHSILLFTNCIQNLDGYTPASPASRRGTHAGRATRYLYKSVDRISWWAATLRLVFDAR